MVVTAATEVRCSDGLFDRVVRAVFWEGVTFQLSY